MTSSFPNEPLWPRAGRSGMSAPTMSSSSFVAPVGKALPASVPSPSRGASRRPKPTGPRSGTVRLRVERLGSIRRERPGATGLGRGAEALDPGEDSPLALVEAVLDVGREDVAPAGHPDAECDRHRVIRFVGDRDGDPLHPQLLGPGGGAAVEPHRRLAGRHPLDLDVAPADPPHTEPKDLGDRFLGRPPAGHRLGPATDVALLRFGQHALREARAELLERGTDPGNADDVDPELGRPGRSEARRQRTRFGPFDGRHRLPYSTVTDLARLRGWSTSVPRATAM